MPSFTAFFIYAFVSSYTPGPNNIMSLANAGKYGFKKTLPFILGVGSGFFLMVICAMAFSMTLYTLIPTLKPWIQGAGSLYLIWLAWKIFKYDPGNSSGTTGTNTYLAAIMLQSVNVKGMLYAIMITSTYITPYYQMLPVLTGFAVILALISLSSCCCWAAFGSLFNRFMKNHVKPVNTFMALLLVYCAVALYL